MPFIARYGFLLLVLVFCGCFHLSIALLVVAFCWYEKPKRATKGKKCPNGNQALRAPLKNKKEQRRAAKGNERQMETRTKNQNEQQKATKSIFHSHFHSFAPVLDQWKVVYIKSNEKPERAMTGNEKQ